MVLLDSGILADKNGERLKKTFFHPIKQKPLKKIFINKSLIVSGLIVTAILGFACVFFLNNFEIIIISRNKNISSSGYIDLLRKQDSELVEISKFSSSPRISKDLIFLTMPYKKRAGFVINSKTNINLLEQEMSLGIKDPGHDFKINMIFRDSNLHSNTRNPLSVRIKSSGKKNSLIKIPLKIAERQYANISLHKINHIRLAVYQEEIPSMQILVKNIFIQKK